MLDYSEYKSFVDIISRSDVSNTYSDVMAKETKALDTIQYVAKRIHDRRHEQRQFIHHSLYEIFMMFFTEMPRLVMDLAESGRGGSFQDIFTKNHRLMLLAILLILIGFILFFLESSNSVSTAT
jgi:hypothetical protein